MNIFDTNQPFTSVEVSPLVDEALIHHSTEGNFVNVYVKNTAELINKDKLQYRAFGVYWWPLKQMMLDRGITYFGDYVDEEVASHVSLESEALTCAAAYRYQVEQINLVSQFESKTESFSDPMG